MVHLSQYLYPVPFYCRECEEVEQWISEKELVAANEELGKDLEHVEVLQKRFADFVHSVLASEDRVVHVNTLADTLLEANHTGELHVGIQCTRTVINNISLST